MLALKTVEEIVEDNHLHAYVLDCYGIDVFAIPDQTLGQVCHDRGTRLEHVEHNLQAATTTSEIDLQTLGTSPVSLVIEYLKHAHHIFVKKSLPYMSKLVARLEPENYRSPQLIKDLKLVFPLFVEDFISHIYQEEDFLFHYVNVLIEVRSGKLHYNQLFKCKEAFSLKELADDHQHADDEMKGIRQLTANYTLGIESDFHLRTIYKELMDFERNLVFHANVENKILFPKAIDLENEVLDRVNSLRNLN